MYIITMKNILFISVFNLGCIEIAENHLMSLIKNNIHNYLAYIVFFGFAIVACSQYQLNWQRTFS